MTRGIVTVATLLAVLAMPAAANARAPRAIKLICVSKSTGNVRYTARSGSCSLSEKQVRLPKGGPLVACRVNGNRLRVVDDPSSCTARKRVILSSTRTLRFCVKKRGGAMRLANKCRRSEFAARLRGHRYPAPKAGADSGTTDEDSAIDIDALGNDTGPGELHVASVDTSGTQGTVTIGKGDKLRYDPTGRFDGLANGALGTDTFTYRLTNGARTTAPATVTVTIGGRNDAPVATNDGAGTNPQATTDITPVANDGDPDAGTTLHLTGLDTAGTVGSVSVAGDTVRYDPAGHFNDLQPGATATDTFRYRATDGSAESAVATVTVTITGDGRPFAGASAGATGYGENAPPVAIDPHLTVGDPDDTLIDGADVRIASGMEAGDHLAFADTPSITGTYVAGTGVLTLTGPATIADYQAALRTVGFDTPNDDPSAARTVEFRVKDDAPDARYSRPVSKGITITPVDDQPTVTTTNPGTTSYTEDAPEAVLVDSGIDVADVDDANLASATVHILSGHQTGDQLIFTDQNGITGSYDAGLGTLTLTGSASKAAYRDALRSVTFRSSHNPTTTMQIEFKVRDADFESDPATHDISVTPVNDAPTVTTSPGQTNWTGQPVAVDPGVTVSDPDDGNLEGATVSISTNFEAGDELQFSTQNGITGNYNSGTGVLTLSGTATVDQYRDALRSVKFDTSVGSPATGKTVSFRVNDGDADSNTANRALSLN